MSKHPPVVRNANNMLEDIFSQTSHAAWQYARLFPGVCSRTCCASPCRTAAALIAPPLPRHGHFNEVTNIHVHEHGTHETTDTNADVPNNRPGPYPGFYFNRGKIPRLSFSSLSFSFSPFSFFLLPHSSSFLLSALPPSPPTPFLFPPLSFFPFSPYPSPLLRPLPGGPHPLNPATWSGERCKLPQRVQAGQSPAAK